MPAQHRRFIVLQFIDRDDSGFDEHTLPALVALMDSAAPDHRQFWNAGVTGYFLTTPDALARVQRVIAQAETLRGEDRRFGSLGIGLAERPLIAEFTWLGRLKDSTPLGAVAADLSRVARTADGYHAVLQRLSGELAPLTLGFPHTTPRIINRKS